MRRPIGYRLLFAVLILVALPAAASADAIIADHAAVEAFDDIPDNWIDSVADLQLYYIHQSHGSQILQGMKILYTEDSRYYPHGMVALWWPYPGGEEMGWNGDTTFVQYIRSYLNSNSDGCNVVSVSWCAGAFTCNEAEINKWMTAWLHLVNDYPDVAFVVQTSRLYDPQTQTFDPAGRNIMRANQYMRNFANAHNMYVMDYGDIEGFNALTGQLDSLANDSGTTWWEDYCDAGNSCPDCVSGAVFPSSTWQLSSMGVTESCAHSYAPEWGGVNCYRKAKAWWWLMARIAGWDGGSGSSDTVPPVISNVSITGIGQSAATVTWTTDEPATSQVEYGLDANYGWFSSLNSTLTTNHSVTLTGLSASTPYHCRPLSRDGSSNLATGSNRSFTTAAAPPPPDTANIGSISVPAGTITAAIPVNLNNFKPLGAFDIPLKWTSPDIICDSVSFSGSRVGYVTTKLIDIDNGNRRLHAGVMVMMESYIPVDSGLVFTVHFSIDPTVAEQTIIVDTTFYPPSGWFSTIDTLGTTYYPKSKGGGITIYSIPDTIPPAQIEDLGNLPGSFLGYPGLRDFRHSDARLVMEMAIENRRSRLL